MAFDWERFLRQHNIEYRDRGANVARGNIVVRCPWCGTSDDSGHLGINLRNGSWGCWRSADHRGRSAVRLVQALINCSSIEAGQIVGTEATVFGGDDTFGSVVGQMLGTTKVAKTESPRLELLPEMKPITTKGMGRVFVEYLVDKRDYTDAEAHKLCLDYDLHYAIRGPFSYRVVVPVFMEQGLATWTGRSVSKDAVPRYKALSPDPERAAAEGLPVASKSIYECFLGYQDLLDHARTGPTFDLSVVEGPMDALRLDFYGQQFGLRSTCFFGKTISPAQVDLLTFLIKLAGRHIRRKVLLLDTDASLDGFSIQQSVQHLGFEVRHPPSWRKDPAEMSRKEVRALVE